jgi:hypothetical protein
MRVRKIILTDADRRGKVTAPCAFPAAAKETLLRTLHELQDRLKLCIDVVERLQTSGVTFFRIDD